MPKKKCTDPLLEATTRDDEVWATVVLKMEGTVAAELDKGRPAKYIATLQQE